MMSAMRIIFTTIILLLTFNTSIHAEELSRKKAAKIFMETGLSEVIVKISADYRNENSKILIEEGLARKSEEINWYTWIPQKKIMSYLYTLTDSKGEGMYLGDSYPRNLLWYGTVKNVKVVGIKTIDNSSKTVEIKLIVEPNKFGRMLFNKKDILVAVDYKLFDDGWRYEKINGEATVGLDTWNHSFLDKFADKALTVNSVLWNMHKLGKYYGNFMKMAQFLEENSKEINELDTVAWVYKDNGNVNKAIEIYEKQILPTAREELSLKDRKVYEANYQKIKKQPVQNKHQPQGQQTSSLKNGPQASKGQKQTMAMMIIQSALEEGKTGEEKTVYWGDDLLYGVTPTRTYRYKNEPCREYKVVSYETGKAVTINGSGDACRSKDDGKWFPAYMSKSPKRVRGDQIDADMIGGDFSGAGLKPYEEKGGKSKSKSRSKSPKAKFIAIKDSGNTISLDTNPTTLEKQKEKAIKLVAYTLENGKIGVEKALSFKDKLLFGVTMTGSSTFLNKYPCRNYTVVSYASGKAQTKLNNGKACKAQGKWYPYTMLSDPSMQSMSGDKFSGAMIGKW